MKLSLLCREQVKNCAESRGTFPFCFRAARPLRPSPCCSQDPPPWFPLLFPRWRSGRIAVECRNSTPKLTVTPLHYFAQKGLRCLPS